MSKPRTLAFALVEVGQLQALRRHLRAALDSIDSRLDLLQRLATEDLNGTAPAFSAEAQARVEEAAGPEIAEAIQILQTAMVREAGRATPPRGEEEEARFHLVFCERSLCGLPASSIGEGQALTIVGWRGRELNNPRAVFELCQRCARVYRRDVEETGVLCVGCNGGGYERVGTRCSLCGGIGRYPEWAAEELEAARRCPVHGVLLDVLGHCPECLSKDAVEP